MILIAIGSNLPGLKGETPLEVCREAVRALAELPGTKFETVSRWYESEPVPRSDQPNYVNGLARLRREAGTGIDPESLLAATQAIESRFGRHRAERNAARILDLDLIDVDGLVRVAPDPVLPHPRTHLRAFVLLPLMDVAPEWVHPGTGLTGLSLLRAVDRTGVRVLAV